jgi:hypothetical protein
MKVSFTLSRADNPRLSLISFKPFQAKSWKSFLPSVTRFL